MRHKYKEFKENPLKFTEKKIFDYQNIEKFRNFDTQQFNYVV